jgi:ABC-type sugar transport system ATPase subunit
VSKRFAATRALIGVDLDIDAGKVLGLIGPNGAGKSTLVGVLTGRIEPDQGVVEIDGAPASFHHPRDAIRAGIVAVPQELVLPRSLTITEFVALGVEESRFGMVRRRSVGAAVVEVLSRVQSEIPPSTRLGELSVSEQKTVMVAQALYRRARVLVLDEPTAGMDIVHSRVIVELVRLVSSSGVGVLYVSHRFDEVEALCDRVVVLRDGARFTEMVRPQIARSALIDSLLSAEEPSHGASPAASGDAISLMVGPVPLGAESLSDESARTTVSIRGLTTSRLRDFHMEARSGEVLGLAGLPGSGIEDVFSSLVGDGFRLSGIVEVHGEVVRSTGTAVRAGIGYLPASRKALLLQSADVGANLVLGALRTMGKSGFVSMRSRRRLGGTFVTLMKIPGLKTPITALSGGTQQKVLVGRLLLQGATVFVLEDPTVGVDVPSRAVLHRMLRELAASGSTCIVGSTEPGELCVLCDRVIALQKGSIAGVLTGSELTEARLISAITA